MNNSYAYALRTQDTFGYADIHPGVLVNNLIDSMTCRLFGNESNKRLATKGIYSSTGVSQTQIDINNVSGSRIQISIGISDNIFKAKLYKTRADEVLLSRGKKGGTLIEARGKSTEEVLAMLLSL